MTNKEAEKMLKEEYHRENFLVWLDEMLFSDYKNAEHAIIFSNDIFSKVTQLGASKSCNLTVFEVFLNEGKQNRRVNITQEMFRILRNQHINNAIVAFKNADGLNYRISLLTSKYEVQGDKVIKVTSNPRRYSYSLGHGTKTKTVFDFLFKKVKVKDLDDLISRFSIDIVNQQFYKEVSLLFHKLVGNEKNKGLLSLKNVSDPKKSMEFVVRLIGRIVFCWFLKEKKSVQGISLLPEAIFSKSGIEQNQNYYNTILEPLFFEVLNTKSERRKDKFATENIYNEIPYLNGGLFCDHADDLYRYDKLSQSGTLGFVTIPDNWFIDFYAVLSQYNFTIDENTSYDVELSIDPEMLGRIFENLLAEINPETGKSARDNTGSFYTPREIVDYMVDSSIFEYLQEKTKIESNKLKNTISYVKEDDEHLKLDKSERQKIVSALYDMTTLDPACGSGAFPIGLLQKIVYIFKDIDPEANLWFDKATEGMTDKFIKREFEKQFTTNSLEYMLKLNIIQKSIFGIDIQPIAVEIARLRCFLSLIIEEKINDNAYNRDVKPLPNLDFKFVIANSLIELEKDKQMKQLSLFEDQNHIDELKNIREEYFNATPECREELKYELTKIQKRMFATTVNENSKLASDKFALLSSWEPFENEPTNWFDSEWMLGIQEGFDIVIANPPYVHLEKIESKIKEQYKPFYTTYEARGDLYCLFYEMGLRNLKKNGYLTFITSNKWMRAGYGASLRNYFIKNSNPIKLIDLGSGRFSSATVDTNILMLQKAKNNNKLKAITYSGLSLDNMSDYIKQNEIDVDFKIDESWTILSPIEQSIKKKIESVGMPLSKWSIKINRGILTGYNEAFIIDKSKRLEILSNCMCENERQKTDEIIRPILRGKDIKRFNYNFAGLYLIATHDGYYNDKRQHIPRINIADYPAIKAHLDKYKDIINKRTDKGGTPYNLRSCAYMDDFSKQKIIFQEMVSESQFVLDSSGDFFCLDTGRIITGKDIEFLISVLNSKLFFFSIKYFYGGGGLGEAGVRMKHTFFENFCCPIFEPECKRQISDLMNKKDYDSIDKLVYKLYNLEKEEINLIEKKDS